LYKVDAATAHLHGSSPRNEEKDHVHPMRYQVAIQK
jgi:hypothetical protein